MHRECGLRVQYKKYLLRANLTSQIALREFEVTTSIDFSNELEIGMNESLFAILSNGRSVV